MKSNPAKAKLSNLNSNHLNLFGNPFEVQFLHLDAINLTSAR